MIAKRHGCGHRIWVEFDWTGHRYAPMYRDNEEEGPTAGKHIMYCPTCGEFLTEDVLLADDAYLDSLDDASPAHERVEGGAIVKRCRSCSFCILWGYCTEHHKVVGAMESCDDYKGAPPLVEELAAALNGMLALWIDAQDTGVSPDVYCSFDEVMQTAFAAQARYQKEVGNAPTD